MNTESTLHRACRLVLVAGLAAWAGFGILFAFLSQAAFVAPLMQALWTPFLGEAPLPPAMDGLLGFMQGLLGAVMIAWSVALGFLAMGPLRRGEGWAWWAILASVLAWFVIDEAFSVRYAVWINVWGNLVLLAWFILPLAVWRLAGRTAQA
jgi:hypothetical protein